MRFTPTKQWTKHVEWYHGDFSDPEAVSGSSTNLELKQPAGGCFLCGFGDMGDAMAVKGMWLDGVLARGESAIGRWVGGTGIRLDSALAGRRRDELACGKLKQKL